VDHLHVELAPSALVVEVLDVIEQVAGQRAVRLDRGRFEAEVVIIL